MFTGIIQDIGKVIAIDKRGDWIVEIAGALPSERTAIGASVACSGVCLTVIECLDGAFKVQLSSETLSKTTAQSWHEGTLVNLEPALRMGDELGGHLVSGHVDGLAKVVSRVDEKDSARFVFEVPPAFACFIAPKGSVTLDGVSLTINEVNGCAFGVNVIPFTQKETTLGERDAGDVLNFEVDLIARYVARMMV